MAVDKEAIAYLESTHIVLFFVTSNFGNLCSPAAVYVVCVFVCVRACDA